MNDHFSATDDEEAGGQVAFPADQQTNSGATVAGDFGDWMKRTLTAQQSKSGMEVPCGECRACCTSSLFVLIEPDETATLAQIPKELLFPAPGLPKGHVVLGYDERGHCPMFVDNRCSIYAQRPRTCRAFDCRVLTASGVQETDEANAIDRQALRWRFDFDNEHDRHAAAAVRATAAFLRTHRGQFPTGFVPKGAAQLAMLAIMLHAEFLEDGALLSEQGARNEAAVQQTVASLIARKRLLEAKKPIAP